MIEIPGYRVVRTLGEGGFGQVYLAERVRSHLSGRVAIKVLRAEVRSSPEALQRLRDEARVLALVQHPAIVRVDDLLEVDGVWCIVMEYVDGRTAAEMTPWMTIGAAARIGEIVAHALHTAWSTPDADGRALSLIHRDIKPSNIQLTTNGDVRILDFGAARAQFAGRESETVSVMLGSMAYIAPERFEGVDLHVSDVYSLGVTLFQLMTGKLPGSAPGDPDRRPPGRHRAAEWAMIAAYDVELSRLLGQMMSHAPEARPNALVVSRRLANIARKHEDESLREWAAAAFSAADRGERPSPDRVRPVTTPTLRGSRDKAQASSHIPAFVGAGLLLLAGLGLSAALFASLLIRLFDPGHVSASAPLANVTAADAPPAPVAPPASAPPPVEDPNPPETSPPAPPVGGPQAVAAQTPSAVASPRSMGSPPVAPAAGTSLAQRPTIRPEAAESGAGTAGTENPWAATTAPTAAPTAAPAVVSTESSATQVACGRIQVSGASYRLARPPASGCAAGQVPAGSYTVIVSFPEEADQSYPISVSRGGVTRLRCDALLSVCQEGGG